jgi:hypothetical protein
VFGKNVFIILHHQASAAGRCESFARIYNADYVLTSLPLNHCGHAQTRSPFLKAGPAAYKDIDETKLLAGARACNDRHARNSSFRRHAEPLSKMLRLLDRLMDGVAIGIQANPDVSAIIIGGVRVVIDLAISFVEFFGRLTDMLCQFEEYLPALATFAATCQDSDLIAEAVAGAYGDILEFCRKALAVFVGSDGTRKTWTSWRVFLRQQWTPFETEFGFVKTNMQHHVVVV